jgi:beta-lactamase class A
MYQHQAEKVFPAGSLIDLAIAAYIEDQWKNNHEIVNEEMEVTDLSRVRGAGIIGDLRRTNWSVRDLVYLTSAITDNVATNLLIEKFDIYEIDEWLKKNYPGLRLGRELMRYSASGQDNECTATSC